jgi:hypothetical protein
MEPKTKIHANTKLDRIERSRVETVRRARFCTCTINLAETPSHENATTPSLVESVCTLPPSPHCTTGSLAWMRVPFAQTEMHRTMQRVTSALDARV